MSKPRSKKAETTRDITSLWADRGFRPDIARTKPRPGEDPKGEESYQRAFYEAAQSNPPRLPNPSNYPNSSSAREYLRKRNRDFLAIRGEQRPGEESSDASRMSRRVRDPDRSPSLQSRQSASTSPASNYSASTMARPPSLLSTPRTEGYQDARSTFPQGLPPPMPRLATLEPPVFGAPNGPTSRYDPFLRRL